MEKLISVELKFDEEFGDYYFQLFGENSDYIWVDSLLKDDKGNLIEITEDGYFVNIKKIDYKK